MIYRDKLGSLDKGAVGKADWGIIRKEVTQMLNYSFTIRRAVVEDAEAIQDIMRESFKKYMEDAGLTGTMEALEESIDHIRKDIESKDVFIAIIDNIPVGSIRVEVLPDKTAFISRFGVKLDYHNIGIGKSLMNLVDKMLKSRGITKVSLYTASKYKDLIRFYYGRGFYIDSTAKDRGYIRALLVKEYAQEEE
jgi:ribosomal protein S18 acetylase RimI-like enzyme